MSLGLHTQCRDRLTTVIAEQLPNIALKNRMFLERSSAIGLLLAEPILPQTGPVKNSLDLYIGEAPIFTFALETLARELYENQKYDAQTPSMKLINLNEYQDSASVAKRLVHDFESLPWKYTLTIKLDNDFAKLFGQAVKEYRISDSLKLVTPDDSFAERFPLQSGIKERDHSLSGGLLLGFESRTWDKNTTYFQANATGFISMYGGTTPFEDTISLFKSFCGISIALRLFKATVTHRAFPSKANCFVHRNVDNAWVIESRHEMEAILSDALQDLTLHDLEGRLDTDSKKTEWIKSVLPRIRCVFSNQEKARKLILGGQWLFESCCGKDELLSFVQAAVVMEILLGEKTVSDLMGLGELLRNRCAYLIGRSHKEREETLSDFEEIYDVRSKIVHSGKSRLNMHERSLLSKLQWMCRRVIQEEVTRLEEDEKEEK